MTVYLLNKLAFSSHRLGKQLTFSYLLHVNKGRLFSNKLMCSSYMLPCSSYTLACVETVQIQKLHTARLFLSDVNPSLFFPHPGTLRWALRARRGGREQEVSGAFQKVAAGGNDPGDRSGGGIAHRAETSVKRRRLLLHQPHTAEVTTKVPSVSELLMFAFLFASECLERAVDLRRWTLETNAEEEGSLVFTCSHYSTDKHRDVLVFTVFKLANV